MADSTVAFGRPMRDAHFLFDPTYVPLNHGSFGTYPKCVRDRLRTIQDGAEAKPDTWLRYEFPKQLDESRASLASFLHVPVSELVLVPNATTGVNTVLRSLVFEKDDIILYFSTLYGGCLKTVEYICETTAAEKVAVQIQYPIDDATLLTRFRDAVVKITESGKRAKIALFDTISSLPGVCVPWEKLCGICNELGVLSMVDGAHGVGQIEVDLQASRPDFFVSNCHKWLYVPRGCAVFYVPERNQKLLRTSIPTSWGFVPLPKPGQQRVPNPLPPSSRTAFENLFVFVATMDDSPYLCVPRALQFRHDVCGGEATIREYCVRLARDGGACGAQILGTEVMDNSEGTLTACCMFNVRLPIDGRGGGAMDADDAALVTAFISDRLARRYETFIATYFHGSRFWARFSCQIYLELRDIEWGAMILRDLCAQVNRGEHVSGWASQEPP